MGICGITKATLANLSGCAYVYDKRGENCEPGVERGAKESSEWCMARDRIRLGLGATKVLAGVWAGARATEKELKIIARGVFANSSVRVEGSRDGTLGMGAGVGVGVEGGGGDSMNGGLGGRGTEFASGGESGGGYGLGSGFEEQFGAGELEYLGMLNGLAVGTNIGAVGNGGISNGC